MVSQVEVEGVPILEKIKYGRLDGLRRLGLEDGAQSTAQGHLLVSLSHPMHWRTPKAGTCPALHHQPRPVPAAIFPDTCNRLLSLLPSATCYLSPQ